LEEMEEKLAEESFLSEDYLRQLMAVGEVDILVAVPTFNNSKTIASIVSAIHAGFARYFPRARAVLINPDGGSTDGTPEIVRSAAVPDPQAGRTLRTVHRVSTSYLGTSGKGSAIRTAFAAVDLLRAKACAVISPDVVSLTPQWVESLIAPIYRDQFDYVGPLYHRDKFDGLLVSNLLYPLVRAVYGKRIREPIGGDLAFSSRLASHCLELDVWREDIAHYALNPWLPTTAMVGGYRIAQSFLGVRVQESSGPALSLPATIRQVVGTLFQALEEHYSFWSSQTGSEAVPACGTASEAASEPARPDCHRLWQTFRSGTHDLEAILRQILSPETLDAIQAIAARCDEESLFPDELWVRTTYEFASSHHRSVIHRDHLVQALTSLYCGRIGSFVQQHLDAEAAQVEERIEGLCLEYERLKPYLLEGWSKKE